MNDDQELITWLQSRIWPARSYRFSIADSTENLARFCQEAIEQLRQGNQASRAKVLNLRANLEAEEANASRYGHV
jgi:hypothetical protein